MGATRWGILSAGKISHDFCVALSTCKPDEHQIVAVAARSEDSAQKFAKLHEIPKAYGSYEALVQDPNVEVVYVGSLNPFHLSHAKLALDHGKHVLCEKPLCINVKEVRELIEYAEKKKLFLMEAIWSRFFPAYQKLREEINNGSIGDVLQVFVTFGVVISEVDRLKQKELGGGATLDIGVYATHFASWVFGGEKPLKVLSSGHLNAEGVDTSASTTLIYSKGRTATLVTHTRVELPNEAYAIGTKGTMKIPSPFWCSDKLQVASGETLNFPLPPYKLKMNYGNSEGLSYQCHEVRKCIQNGQIESSILPHSESITIAEIMESIRKQVGVVYPQDA